MSSMTPGGYRDRMAESLRSAFEEIPCVSSRSVDAKQRIRNRPVEGKSKVGSARSGKGAGRQYTILQIPPVAISMSFDLHVQQPPTRPQDTLQEIRALNQFTWCRLVHQRSLRVLDTATARETIARAEYIEKLFVRESIFTAFGVNLAREHGRELFVKSYELLSYSQTLGLESIENAILCVG